MNLNTLNDLHKPALDGIGYQDLLTTQATGWTSSRAAYGKTVAWLAYLDIFKNFYANKQENKYYYLQPNEVKNEGTIQFD